MGRRAFVAFAVATLCSFPVSAAAGLRALGHEFRPTDAQRAGEDLCTDADGVTASLAFRCHDPYPDGSCPDASTGELRAVWKTADGTLVAGPHLVSDHDKYARIACAPDGAIFVLIDHRVRVVGRDGPRSNWTPLCDDDACSPWDAYPAANAGGFFVAWTIYRDGVFGRRFDADGAPASEVFQVAVGTSSGFDSRAVVVTDSEDRLVVAWMRSGSSLPNQAVLAALVSEAPVGDPVQLNEFPGGLFEYLVASRQDDGNVLVAWDNNQTQAGWIARRVSASDEQPTTTTTTTSTTLDPDVPIFLPAREIHAGYAPENDWYPANPPSLAGDGAGAWIASWIDYQSLEWPRPIERVVGRSNDDGRRWSKLEPNHPWWPEWDSPVVTDGEGVALNTKFHESYYGIWFRRSIDGARTWNQSGVPSIEFEVPADLPSGVVVASSVRLAPGSHGRWVAAWIERLLDMDAENSYYDPVRCSVRASLSTDGGVSWRRPQTIGDAHCQIDPTLQVGSDRSGNWLVAWEDPDGIRASRSANDGATWSVPNTIVTAGNLVRDSMALAAGRDGRWVLAMARVVEGTGARIFTTHSSDLSKPWSPPLPLAPWHDEEGGRDQSPSLAVSDDGVWGLAWISHAAATGAGLDADVVVAFSNDGGSNWSAARLVDSMATFDSLTDSYPRIAYSGLTWGVLWSTRGEPEAYQYGDPWPSTIRFARTAGGCGNGMPDIGEECDDANDVEGDGCDTTCLVTGCGSEVVTGDEECDDGDSDDTDECLSDCRLAVCGDGALHDGFESCDDGNRIDTDACRNTCTPAACGDGVVETGVEECDEGANTDNNDGCLASCRLARCGDGYVQIGQEDCDDGNTANGDRCTRRCRLDPMCRIDGAGQTATAGESLRVLRKAVGIVTRCPKRRCDVDGNGRVTADDALRTLKLAVGLLTLGNKCASPQSLLLRLAAGTRLGALQFELSFADAAGEISVEDGKPKCRSLAPQLLSAFALHAERAVVTAGFVALQEFEGPLDLLRCEYQAFAGPSPNDFRVTVQDATDSDGVEVTPRPTIEVVAE